MVRFILFIALGVVALYAGESPTYTDKITGLMWQNSEAVSKPWLDMNSISARKCLLAGDGEACVDGSGDTAATYCENLHLEGFDDWRLPSVIELSSLGRDGFSDWKIPTVEHPAEPGVRGGAFWTATSARYRGEPREAAYTVMYVIEGDQKPDTGILTQDKNSELSVRCVRGESIKGSLYEEDMRWKILGIAQ